MTSINRWILRRQRKLFVGVCLIFIVLVMYVLVYHEDIQIADQHFQPFSERCRTGSSRELIKSIVSDKQILM